MAGEVGSQYGDSKVWTPSAITDAGRQCAAAAGEAIALLSEKREPDFSKYCVARN
jgi:hypothetical protein